MPAPFRKACTSCVRAKRRCDLGLPRCYRCKVRSLDCSYPNLSSHSTPQDIDPASDTTQGRSVGPISDSGPSDGIEQTQEAIDNAQVSTGSGEDQYLPPFPDYDLDWPDVMGDLDSFVVPGHMIPADSPQHSVLAGEAWQGRVVYAVSRIKSYLPLLVSSGRTPFLHEKLYSEHLPVAVQDALGSCALYAQRNSTNEPLIFRMISDKANHLIREPMSARTSPLEQLASVQALILYRIIRLFDGDIRLRADAETAFPTLKDWTVRLRSFMRQAQAISSNDSIMLSASNQASSSLWRDWILEESLRRTVIASYTIQGLYSFLKNGWDDSDDDFMNLSFSAQRALWHAASEYNWNLALEEHASLPICFSTWDADIGAAEPSDLDDLGVTMMALMKGVDECSRWLGPQYLEKYGLQLSDDDKRLC